ncbi:MAG TPA: hypothetical protein VF952_08810 [Chloroflexia bacterium]|jgi:hypothetical protein
MAIPTRDDAHMLIELFKLRLDPLMQESQTWFEGQFQPGTWEEIQTRYPVGSKEWRMLNTVLGYWEMVGALIDQNLISDDLIFDAMESLDVAWDKVNSWLPEARSQMGPDLWENIELLVNRQKRWRYTRLPKAQRI